MDAKTQKCTIKVASHRPLDCADFVTTVEASIMYIADVSWCSIWSVHHRFVEKINRVLLQASRNLRLRLAQHSNYETAHTFTGTEYESWKELALALGPACGPSSPSTSVPLLPYVSLAFFLGGAAAADVDFKALGFNAWCLRFLTSGIVFDGSMSAS
jgi:hypothetical protein